MSLVIDATDFRTKLRAFLREHTLDILWLISQGNGTQRAMAKEISVSITAISRILPTWRRRAMSSASEQDLVHGKAAEELPSSQEGRGITPSCQSRKRIRFIRINCISC